MEPKMCLLRPCGRGPVKKNNVGAHLLLVLALSKTRSHHHPPLVAYSLPVLPPTSAEFTPSHSVCCNGLPGPWASSNCDSLFNKTLSVGHSKIRTGSWLRRARDPVSSNKLKRSVPTMYIGLTHRFFFASRPSPPKDTHPPLVRRVADE